MTPARVHSAAILAVFTTLLWGLSPGMPWGDAGEYVTASVVLGNTHYPGSPTAAVYGKLFAWVPLGDVPVREAFGCATAWSLALFVWVRAGASPSAELPRSTSYAAWIPAFWLVSHPSALKVGVHPETHALLGLGLACLVLTFASSARIRSSLASGAIMGLILSVKPEFLALAPALLFMASRKQVRACAVVLALSVAAGCYVYLPLRSAQEPYLDFGRAQYLAGYVRALLDLNRARLEMPASAGYSPDWLGAAKLLLGAMGPFMVFSIFGVSHAMRSSFRLVLPALYVFLVLAAIPVFYREDEREQFAILAAGPLVSWAAMGMSNIVRSLAVSRKGLTRRLPGLLLVGLLISAAVALRAGRELRGSHDHGYGLRYAQSILQRLPAGCRWVTHKDRLTFLGWYLQGVEHARPDVQIVPDVLLAHSWFIKTLDLPRREALGRGGSPFSLSDEEISTMTTRFIIAADDAPVRVESYLFKLAVRPGDTILRPNLAQFGTALVPDGLVFRPVWHQEVSPNIRVPEPPHNWGPHDRVTRSILMTLGMGRALAWADAGRADRARTAFEQLLKRFPSEPRAWHNWMAFLYNQRDYEAARAAARTALRLDPSAEEPAYLLSLLAIRSGEWSEAERLLRELSRRESKMPEVHNNFGNLLKRRGFLREARAAYQRAVELRPGFQPYVDNLKAVLKELGEAPDREPFSR